MHQGRHEESPNMPITSAVHQPPHLPTEHVDVLIVGAGLSGIGVARHLQAKLPGKTYAILESRGASGGTWDLFRYPGIRSDSDLQTLGYAFKPWTDERAIADGGSILDYIRETAVEHGIDRHIRFHHQVVRAEWSSPESRWTVEARRGDTGESVRMTAAFLFMASGYYRYDKGYMPEFPGAERFQGRLVHPQHWPEDLDYAGKRVVVIGSGATAVTLVPAMTDRAAHVTMLQRSPSYIMALPAKDPIANGLRRLLGDRLAYRLTRRKNVWMQTMIYRLSRRHPRTVRRLLRAGVKHQLPRGYDIDTHFSPRYDPWDQRMCMVPDGDLFKAISAGRASVATDRIETFTERGIKLASGAELEADIIVSATGLNLLAFGGLQLAVDGREIALPGTTAYKGTMLGDVPNLAYAIGYTNASWTLKVDLVGEYFCRLLALMDKRGHDVCVPYTRPTGMPTRPYMESDAGYVARAIDTFPRKGTAGPWRLNMSYAADLKTLRDDPIDDGVLRFGGRTAPALAA
jgi:monooxygenase